MGGCLDMRGRVGHQDAVHRVARILTLLAALVVVDGQMVIGQSWAWLTMVHDRAPEMGFAEAVADTLSGDHPCERCLSLKEGRKKEKEEAPINETRPLAKFAPVVGGSMMEAAYTSQTPGAWESFRRNRALIRSDDVPSPPPRLG